METSKRKALFKEGMNNATTGQKLAKFFDDTFGGSDKDKDKERKQKEEEERRQARTELPTERH